MEVRMLRDWSYHKKDEIVEVWEPTARNWMMNGIAEEVVVRPPSPEPAPEVRDVAPEPVVESADAPEPDDVERADRRPKRR